MNSNICAIGGVVLMLAFIVFSIKVAEASKAIENP